MWLTAVKPFCFNAIKMPPDNISFRNASWIGGALSWLSKHLMCRQIARDSQHGGHSSAQHTEFGR